MSDQEPNEQAIKKILDDLDKRHSKLRWLWLMALIPIIVGVIFVFWTGNTVTSATNAQKSAKRAEKEIESAERKLLMLANRADYEKGGEIITDLNMAINAIEQQLSEAGEASDSLVTVDDTSQTQDPDKNQEKLDALNKIITDLNSEIGKLKGEIAGSSDVYKDPPWDKLYNLEGMMEHYEEL